MAESGSIREDDEWTLLPHVITLKDTNMMVIVLHRIRSDLIRADPPLEMIEAPPPG